MSSVTFSDLPPPPLRTTRSASESILRSSGEMRALLPSGSPTLPTVPIAESDEDDRAGIDDDSDNDNDRGEGPSRPRSILRTGAVDRSRSDGPPSYEASSPDGPPFLAHAMGRMRLGLARDAPPIADFFGTSPATRGEALPDVGLPRAVNGADDDDPLVPRLLRHPPTPNLRALQRRYTISEGVSSPVTSPVLDEAERASPPPLMAMPPMTDFVAGLMDQPLDLPPPPSAELPAYNPHLARDELRLISAVHLDQNHPAAAYFTAVSSSVNRVDQPQETPLHEDMSTGGKKVRVVLNRGGERMNKNGTGPMYIRMGRRGRISGRIQVGKVDHATDLEVAIIGLVNTSYYVRGQYTLIDTLPLGRERMVLWPPGDRTPPGSPTSEAFDQANRPNGVASRPDGSSSSLPSPSTTTPLPAAAATSPTPSSSTATPPAPTQPAAAVTATPTPSKVLMKNIKRRLSSQNTTRPDEETVNWVPQNRTFDFDLNMPYRHFRDENVELPPSCQIIQVGMQAGIEYYLRVKLTRKGWRLNETISVPIIYEPRSYITPRRLRALTYNDVLNPGWRTIKLHGGKPIKTTTPAEPATPGVEVSLLLPSPPILFVGYDQPAPPVPFHLHFHSASTLPLKTFSDPRECIFVVRLMRVATMRIATEKEIRRVEIPSRVEVWQEGGPHVNIGQEMPTTANTVTTAPVLTDEPAAEDLQRVSSPPVHPVQPVALTPAGLPIMSPARSTSTESSKKQGSSLADKRPAWMRRRSSSSTPSGEAPTARVGVTTAPGVAPIPESEAAPAPASSSSSHAPHPLNRHVSASAAASAEAASPFTPLSLDATDVHLLGALQIDLKAGWEISKRLIQSFQTPEISVSYVLEVGLQPRQGAVREAFEHVWGGGLVEIVHGPRPPGAPPLAPPSVGAVLADQGMGMGATSPVSPAAAVRLSAPVTPARPMTPGGLMAEAGARARPASAGHGSALGTSMPTSSGLGTLPAA